MLEWTYAGVDNTLAGNGGQACVDFISARQRWMETILMTTIAALEVALTFRKLTLPTRLPPNRTAHPARRIILSLLCLTFGVELGFKFATQQLIWLLNPCHIVTIMQIYLLIATHSRTTMYLFRIHLHCLHGATIAIILPVVNTRLLTCETEVYYIQHILMLIVPYFLMREEGAYTAEPLKNCSWDVFSCGVLFIYHWVILQALGILSLVNLNSMICPAVSDPFYGQWYRIWGSGHQTLIILLHGKLYTWMVNKMLPSAHTPSVSHREVDQHLRVNGYCKHE